MAGAASPAPAPGPGKRSLVEQLGAPPPIGPPGKQTRVATVPATVPAPVPAQPGAPPPDDADLLASQARLATTDAEIPALEGALLATRQEAVKRGLISQPTFDAGLALSQAMTQLQPAVAARAAADPGTQERAAIAAQHLFRALQRETAGDRNFHTVPATTATTAITAHNPYTDQARVTTTFLIWTRSHDVESRLARLPALIRGAAWPDAFRDYRALLDGLDLWIADQLRARGGDDAARGNAQQHFAQLRTGLDQIADHHATRHPAVFRPDAKTLAHEKAAGRRVPDAVAMNVYFWRDAATGKVHLFDLTTPGRPHAQIVDASPSAAMLGTFFEDVARYPEGEIRFVLPDGAAGAAATTGKTRWYEWVGYAGLALAAVGLAALTAGASVPATLCFAAGAVAGGAAAGGHLADTAHLGIATTATVVIDVAQLVASFASAGAMTIAVKAGSAGAALAAGRWFVPLVTASAVADTVQLVALTELAVGELRQIERGAGSDDDKRRAMAVLVTQLIVTGGLTAISVHGARDARALAGHALELVEQNGVQLLRVAGDDAAHDVARIRTGTPGAIRGPAELSSGDVARAMNAQLDPIAAGDLDALLRRFPRAQQARAREVLARASGFGHMEALNPLRDALEPHLAAGKRLYLPGAGSLADNLHYLSMKGSFPAHPAEIAFSHDLAAGGVVILDDVVLARVKADPGFAAQLRQPSVVLVEPRGFTAGLNMFNAHTPEAIATRTRRVLERANQLQAASGGALGFDAAITQALDEPTRGTLQAAHITGTLHVVDPAARPDLSSTAVAHQLNGRAGIDEATLEAALAAVPDADRAMLRELLAQQSEIYSPRRISKELIAQHQRILALAAQRGIAPEHVYFLIPQPEKSYGMMAMAHREATGTPVARYLDTSREIASRKLGADTMVVVLDDVAGSGNSLSSASIAASSGGYKGQVVIAPMVSTAKANHLFTNPTTGLATHRPNTSYLPGRVMNVLERSPYYLALPPDQQQRMLKLLGRGGLGFDDNGLSMAFPYMAPDNNNRMFGDHVAREFIMNQNRHAAKTGVWEPESVSR
ncbi:MAG TPA: hypothetical protein VFP84_13260 [Kofleriaceae bacterium]|nr:hypothetical protein [Kofleriaceae bacterium]